MNDLEIKQGQIWQSKLFPAQKVRANLVFVDTVFFNFLGSKEGSDCSKKIFQTFYESCQVSANYKYDSTHEKGEQNNQVNHPKHYTSDPSGVECIEISENWSFCLGNALKYLWRSGKKDADTSIQDLEKAIWYIEREIARQKKLKNTH